jgi:predicted transcriptional regulator
MTRLTITLNDEEKKALSALAIKEFRDPHAQAMLIIRKELERLKLIKTASSIQDENRASRSVEAQPVDNKTPVVG